MTSTCAYAYIHIVTINKMYKKIWHGSAGWEKSSPYKPDDLNLIPFTLKIYRELMMAVCHPRTSSLRWEVERGELHVHILVCAHGHRHTWFFFNLIRMCHKSSGEFDEREEPWLKQPGRSLGGISKSHASLAASGFCDPKPENKEKPGMSGSWYMPQFTLNTDYVITVTPFLPHQPQFTRRKMIYKITSLNPYRSTSM